MTISSNRPVFFDRHLPYSSLQNAEGNLSSDVHNPQGDSFASILTDVIRGAENHDGQGQTQALLGKEQIQELIVKIRERMDSSMLRMAVGDAGTNDSSFPRFASIILTPPPALNQASNIRRTPTKSDVPIPGSNLKEIIERAAETYGVDKDLVSSVIRAESGFKVKSLSPKGASGLMQLMPETARELGVQNVFDPVENVMGGTRYLRGLLDRYQGDIKLALAAYNWGMGNLEKHPESLPRETSDYISRILRYLNEAKA